MKIKKLLFLMFKLMWGVNKVLFKFGRMLYIVSLFWFYRLKFRCVYNYGKKEMKKNIYIYK